MKKGVEVSYLELAGTASVALAYTMAKGLSIPESIPDFAYNAMFLGGTLLFSKAGYQGMSKLRELAIGKESANTNSSAPNTREMLRK